MFFDLYFFVCFFAGLLMKTYPAIHQIGWIVLRSLIVYGDNKNQKGELQLLSDGHLKMTVEQKRSNL